MSQRTKRNKSKLNRHTQYFGGKIKLNLYTYFWAGTLGLCPGDKFVQKPLDRNGLVAPESRGCGTYVQADVKGNSRFGQACSQFDVIHWS